MSINAFCAGTDDVRHYLRSPFKYKGHKVCTNGHICVIGRLEQEEISEPPKQIKSTSVFESIINFVVPAKKVTIDSINEQDYLCYPCRGAGVMEKCHECGGAGVVYFENQYNEYEPECLTCEGQAVNVVCQNCNGRKVSMFGKDKKRGFPIGECFVDPGYVKMILQYLGPADFYPHGKEDMVLFEAGGCKGGLMPLRL